MALVSILALSAIAQLLPAQTVAAEQKLRGGQTSSGWQAPNQKLFEAAIRLEDFKNVDPEQFDIKGAYGQRPFSFSSYIGEDFFGNNTDIEASGLVVAPDGSHLVVVSDEGEIIFLNLIDYNSGHCKVDLTKKLGGSDDLEGVAIDTAIWTPGDMHAYVVHEGADDDEPILFKIEYEYDNDGSCSASVVSSESLKGAIPCLEDSNGIASLGLKTESSGSDPAVFFVGIQDTGKVYEVTSTGLSTGAYSCFDAGLDKVDVSASTYDGTYLWSIIDKENVLAVIDPAQDCTVAKYDFDPPVDKDGLTIDFDKGLMYVATDESPSSVAVYDFIYPVDLGPCIDAPSQSCNFFTVCGADGPATTTSTAATTTTTTTATLHLQQNSL